MVLRLLGVVERAGSKLPHPLWLFAVLSAVLALVSWGWPVRRLRVRSGDRQGRDRAQPAFGSGAHARHEHTLLENIPARLALAVGLLHSFATG